MVQWKLSRPIGGSVVIASLGAIVFSSYLVHIVNQKPYLSGPLWLLALSTLLVTVLSMGLVYSGYWLETRGFTGGQGWRVTIWCFAGLLGALALTFWPVFYQRIVGVAIEDPGFILIVGAAIGANAGVLVGIPEIRLRHQLTQVEKARDSLEFLNRLLRHNVLNAVTAIRGNAELIIDESEADATVTKARTIHTRSGQIGDLIQNTKMLIDRVDGYNELEPVDLSAIVAEQVEQARKTYRMAEIDTDLASNVTVCADPLVSAVIENVVSNAIVHNDQSAPRVTVRLETQDEHATLFVADNGPGVPETELDQLVDPGRHGDHGIGLHLVDTLVSQYNGDLHFDTNESRGTLVTIELPLA